jgi:hypothetical protein
MTQKTVQKLTEYQYQRNRRFCIYSSSKMSTILSLAYEHPHVDASSVLGLIIIGAILYISAASPQSNLPLINGLKKGEFRQQHARRRFVAHAHDLIQAGFAKVSVHHVQYE